MLVPCDHIITNKVSELLANEGVAHVNDPLARNLVHVTVIREVAFHPGILVCKLKNLLDVESLVLRASKVLDVIALEEAFLLLKQV